MFRAAVMRPRAFHPAPVSRLIPQTRMALPAAAFSRPGMRFNSTSSEIQSTLTQFSDEITSASTMTSDQLGYMDLIGLAQGYGPTAIVERLLELTHVYTGLPWWGSIIAATLALRIVLFPLYVKASANAAKMQKIKPQLDELTSQMRSSNPQDVMQASYARKKLFKDNDVKMLHQFFPLIQIPFAFGFYRSLTDMAKIPVEGFSTQGVAWFTDLSQYDPYVGLQCITAFLALAMFRLGGETGAMQVNPAFKKVMLGLPFLAIFVTYNFSAATVLYFATNSIFSLFQTLVLRNPAMRKAFKLPTITKAPAAKSNQSLGDWWKDFQQKQLDTARNRLEQSNQKLGAMQKRRREVNKNFIKKH